METARKGKQQLGRPLPRQDQVSVTPDVNEFSLSSSL